jgi:hypothetical protein
MLVLTLTFFRNISINTKKQFKMKHFFILEPGPPSNKAVKLTYYLLLVLAISIGLAFILDGIADPFGGITILIGSLLLILIPLCLRIIFGQLLNQIKNKNNTH